MNATVRPITYPGEFQIDRVWLAIQALLTQQLPGVAVDAIGEKDFDEDGMLTINPPAARVVFGRERMVPFGTQASTYNAEQDFAVICADQDLGPDPQTQRSKSAILAAQVKHILTGARLVLGPGESSEPIECTGVDPLPTAEMGMAYVVGFLICGIAQFAAPNAYPQGVS